MLLQRSNSQIFATRLGWERRHKTLFINRCVEKIYEIRKRGGEQIIAFIDLEKNSSQRALVERLVEKCRKRQCGNVAAHFRESGDIYIVFNGGPESLLEDIDIDLRDRLKSSEVLEKVKAKCGDDKVCKAVKTAAGAVEKCLQG